MATRWISVRNISAPALHFDQPLAARATAFAAEVITPAAAEKISNFKAYQRQTKKTLSTSVSVSPIFKGDGDYSDFTYSYFAGAFSDRIRTTPGDNNAIIAERFGVGIELELTITNLSTSLKGGFGIIAAAVEMQLAKVDYSYHIYGLPPGNYFTLLPQVGQFDSKVIDQFKALVDKVKAAYQGGIANIPLVAIEVLLSSPVKDEGTQYTRSYYFACKQIINGKSLKMAIQQARQSQGYNEDAIQYIYSRVGVRSIEDIPNTQNQSDARALFGL